MGYPLSTVPMIYLERANVCIFAGICLYLTKCIHKYLDRMLDRKLVSGAVGMVAYWSWWGDSEAVRVR